MSDQDDILHQGEHWRRLATLPAILASGWQHTLLEAGVISLLRTPFGWADLSPLLGTAYSGDVALYVPQAQWEAACHCYHGEERDD